MKNKSVLTLDNMRQFYLAFQNLHALRGELTWAHYKCFLKVPSSEGKQGWVSPLGSSLGLGKNN